MNPRKLTKSLNLTSSEIEEEMEVLREDVEKALEWCDYSETRYGSLTRKFFNQKGKLLADIIRKALLCKTGSHDTISKLMFKIMTRVILGKRTYRRLVVFQKADGQPEFP